MLWGDFQTLADRDEAVAYRAAAVLVNADTLFTIAGGAIQIMELYLRCATDNDATASTIQFKSLPTVGTAKTISAASASVASQVAGSGLILNPTALTTAPDIVTAANGGVFLGANVANRIIIPAGTLGIVVGVGSTTGTWTAHLRYKPMRAGIVVS